MICEGAKLRQNNGPKVHGVTHILDHGAANPIVARLTIQIFEILDHCEMTPEENRWGVWANGWGDWVSVSNDGSVKGYDFTTGGFIIGLDCRITDHFAIGLVGSYAHTGTNLQPSGDIDVNTGRGGLYATYFDHGFYINAAAYGGHNSYDTSRQGLLGMANGSTSSGEFSTWTEVGYDFHFGDFTVSPMADFFRRVLICLWHKTSPLGRIATATNSLIKCGGKQALKRAV